MIEEIIFLMWRNSAAHNTGKETTMKTDKLRKFIERRIAIMDTLGADCPQYILDEFNGMTHALDAPVSYTHLTLPTNREV